MDTQSVNLFSGPIATLTRSLDLRARNHEMILNNVANADTPNYKPFEMNVEEALQQGPAVESQMPLQGTDDRHLNAQAMPATSIPAATKSGDGTLLLRGDGNGVDIDAEMTALAKNSLLYRVSAQIVASKFKGLKNAITGGSK